MSENKSNKSMRDKLALVTYLSTNPHIIIDGVELISKGAKLASECSEFVARIKQAGNTSVLFNLIKNKEDENKEQTVVKTEVKIDNSFYYAYEDNNTVVASVVVPQEALQVFKKIDVSEDILHNRINSNVIAKSNFEWFDGRIINNKQYKSILEANNYLGNKLTLQVDSVVTEDYANGQVYIQFTILKIKKNTSNVLIKSHLIQLIWHCQNQWNIILILQKLAIWLPILNIRFK